MIQRTQTGTLIAGRVEYNEYPPPQALIKAMKRGHAFDLVDRGVVRLRKLQYYQAWEKKVLGDPNEGKGLYHMNDHPMQTESVNDVYAWCACLPSVTPERLALIAHEGEYDCLIRLHDCGAFFSKVAAFLSNNRRGFHLHCGLVTYNRGAEVDKKTLNSQKFHFNVFQKCPDRKDDMEYRMSVINYTFHRLPEDHLDLVLGNCGEIVSIEDLPNKGILTTSL